MRAFTTLNIAVVAPIPNAMVNTAAAVKAGCFRRVLTAYRRSLSSESIRSTSTILVKELDPLFRARAQRCGLVRLQFSKAVPYELSALPKSPKSQLDRVSTGSGSDLVNDISHESFGNIAC